MDELQEDAAAVLVGTIRRQKWPQTSLFRYKRLTGHSNGVRSVAFGSPDGKTIVSGSADKTLIRWNVATGQRIGEPLTGHSGPVKSVAFSPDGKTIVSGSDDKTLIRWDVATGQRIGEPLTGHSSGVIRLWLSRLPTAKPSFLGVTMIR